MTSYSRLISIHAITLLSTVCFADGFDNSYFPFQIYTGPSRIEGTYTATRATIKPTLEAGTVTSTVLPGGPWPTSEVTTNQMYGTRYSPTAGVHYQLRNWLGLSYQYQKPFATDTHYDDDIVGPGFPIDSYINTNLHSVSANYVTPFGIGLLNFIGGAHLLSGTASFSVDLFGGAIGAGTKDNLYVAIDINNNSSGFFGMSYEVPAIAMKAQLYYHPQMEATGNGTINYDIGTIGAQGIAAITAGLISPPFNSTIKTNTLAISPNRLQLHLQSGISSQWLAFVNYSYVNWQATRGLSTTITGLSAGCETLVGLGLPACIPVSLALFEDNGHYWALGLGHQYSERLAFTTAVFFDTIRNNPVDDFRIPNRGTTSYYLGSNYDVTNKLTLKARLGIISAPYTEIVEDVTSAFLTGSYKAKSNPKASNLHLGFEYYL